MTNRVEFPDFHNRHTIDVIGQLAMLPACDSDPPEVCRVTVQRSQGPGHFEWVHEMPARHGCILHAPVIVHRDDIDIRQSKVNCYLHIVSMIHAHVSASMRILGSRSLQLSIRPPRVFPRPITVRLGACALPVWGPIGQCACGVVMLFM